ncbi:MAG: PAS domain S-box protein, partial [Syntrophobacteraceae bacterium]
ARDLGKFQLLHQRAGKVAYRLPVDYEQDIREGVLGYVYRTREPANISNVQQDGRFKHIFKRPGKGSRQMISELCLPIITRDLFWILNIEDSRSNVFAEEEVQSLKDLLDNIKVFLDLAWLRFVLKQTLESTSDLVIVTDRKGRINKVNPSVKEFLGYEVKELKNKNFKDRFKNRDQAESIEKTYKSLSDRVTLLRKDGGEVDVLLSSADLPKPISGKVYIAKNLKYERRAEELEYLGKMFYEIAMQTQTPLSLVFSWLNGFREELTTKESRENLDSTIRQLRKLELTFDRMALYDKDKSAVQYNEMRFDIQEVIRGVWDDFPKAELNKIETQLEEGLPYVRGDLFQLTFCIETILAYLLRFVPEDRKITLSMSRSEHGIGIAISGFSHDPSSVVGEDNTLRRLVSRSRTEMALGEKTIRSFIDNHKGKFDVVQVDSESVTFRIELPAARD